MILDLSGTTDGTKCIKLFKLYYKRDIQFKEPALRLLYSATLLIHELAYINGNNFSQMNANGRIDDDSKDLMEKYLMIHKNNKQPFVIDTVLTVQDFRDMNENGIVELLDRENTVITGVHGNISVTTVKAPPLVNYFIVNNC